VAKSVGVSDEAYQYIKGFADANGLSITEAASEVILERKLANTPPSIPVDTEAANDPTDPRKLETAEIDQGMGYERKEDEVTARDGLSALYAISRGGKNDMGIDKS
jgi:hypothetical protein